MTRISFEPVPSLAPSERRLPAANPVASPNAFGADVAQATEKLGDAGVRAGGQLMDAAIAKQNLDNEVYVAENNNWLTNKVTEEHSKFGTLTGRAAMDEFPAYKQRLEELYQESIGSARSPAEKAMLAKAGRVITSRYMGYGSNHANAQSRAWADKTAFDRAKTYGDQASIANLNGDTDGMLQSLHTSDDEVAKLFEQKGYDPEAISAEVAKNRGTNLRRIIEETAQENPDRALEMFIKYRGEMDSENGSALRAKLQPQMTAKLGRQIGENAVYQQPMGTLQEEIDRSASVAGIDPSLLRGVVRLESGGNSQAVRGSYKGLGQLSDDLFEKYGGGNIFNPRDNLRATAKKLADESQRFEGKYGRAPTPAELYLTHQQGEGGFAAHMANPDQPAWQNMASTKEGRQKGDAWAKQAIWGNLPDSDKARFGSVENVTSRAFMGAWSTRMDSAVGAGLPDKGEAITRARAELRSVNASPALENATMGWITKRYAQYESENALEKQSVTNLAAADVASLKATGTGLNDLSPDRVRRALGPIETQKWLDKRNDAQAVWSASNDLYSLTDDQIADRLAAIAPKAGDVDFERKQKVYDAVSSDASELRKSRNTDPAASVEQDPMVLATGKIARQDKAGYPALLNARLAAQTRAGIPEDNQSPITKEEAEKLTVPLRRMLPGQERETLEELARTFQQQFGDHAEQAFQYALRVSRMESAAAQSAARVLRKLSLGLLPAREDAETLDRSSEIGDAQKAITAPSVAPPSIASDYANDPMTGIMTDRLNNPSKEVSANVPSKAVQALRTDPKLAPQFDAKYGKGTAKKILETYRQR